METKNKTIWKIKLSYVGTYLMLIMKKDNGKKCTLNVKKMDYSKIMSARED